MMNVKYREVKYLPKTSRLVSGKTNTQYFVKKLSQFSNLLEGACLGDKTSNGRVDFTLWFQRDIAKPCERKEERQARILQRITYIHT